MINTQNLGEKLVHMFNFMYEVDGNYYALGRDYFRVCTDLEIGVYKGYEEALKEKEEDWIIEQYKRVRKYVSDCQPCSGSRDKGLLEFVKGLKAEELESLSRQMDKAEYYAQIAYNR